jgi:hypothetical protein
MGDIDDELTKPFRNGMCLPIMFKISDREMGAYPTLREKIIVATRATINRTKTIFHREERFEWLRSTSFVVIMFQHKKRVKES